MGLSLKTTIFGLRFASFVTLLALLAACEGEAPKSTESDSTGGGTGATKNVTIGWTASRAKEVGDTGGGYKIYIAIGKTPTASNTTPIDVPNPGNGTHVTQLITPLAVGTTYRVAVQAYSAAGASELSTARSVKVSE